MSGKYSMSGFLLVWLLLVPVYLAFASNVGYRELIASAAAAGVATSGAIVYARQRKIKFRFKLAFVTQAARLPAVLLKDTCLVLVQVATRLRGRQLCSSVVTVGFDCGDGASREAGRRALAVTFLTLTPNTVVLDVCAGNSELVFHELAPSSLPVFARAMGAAPKEPLC